MNIKKLLSNKTLNTAILLLLVVYFALFFWRRNQENFENSNGNGNGNGNVKEKPTVEETIKYFKQIQSSKGGLKDLNDLIKKEGYPNYQVSLRAFFQLIKLNLKNELTSDKIKHFL